MPRSPKQDNKPNERATELKPRTWTHQGSMFRPVVPNLGGIPPRGEFCHLWGDEQLSKTIQHLFGLKIHLIYNSKASDSLNFHEIKFN